MSFERGRPSARATQAPYARHARCLAAPTPADRALDIGTGTGFTAFALAGDGARVLAVDLTPEMLAEGRRLAGGVGLGGKLDWLPGGAGGPPPPRHTLPPGAPRAPR